MSLPGLIDRNRATLKFLFVGLLSLVMLIPLGMVRGLIAERQGLQAQAASTIAQRWGGQQNVSGLVALTETTVEVRDTQGLERRSAWRARVLPELAIDASLSVEWRYLGIYEVPVYVSSLTITGRIDWQALEAFQPEGDLVLWLPLGDVRGVRDISALELGGERIEARPLAISPAAVKGASPSYPYSGSDLATGLQFTVPDSLRRRLAATGSVDSGQPSTGAERRVSTPYRLELTLAGSGCLLFLPLADSSEVALEADWPHPEFVGQFLPVERTVGETTSARWNLLGLNRPFGDEWLVHEMAAHQLNAAGFGMRLETPVDGYRKSERTAKYGLLFIALTFFALFLFEVMTARPLHPVPYLLTGAALAVFYLVLLALSEYLAFAPAFALASGLLLAIVAPYAAVVLGGRSRGLWVGAMMGATYGLLYVLVSAEHAALLLGALALLAAIAALMYLTRGVDWYGYGRDGS